MSTSQDRSGHKVIALLCFALLTVATIVTADWSEHRLVAELAEAFLANALYLGALVGSIAGGYFAGAEIAGLTRSSVLGWIVGMAVFVGVGCLMLFVTTQIPGVGWRIERQMESSSYE